MTLPRRFGPLFYLAIVAVLALLYTLGWWVITGSAQGTTPATEAWMPPLLPTAPPIEFVSAIKTTGMQLRVDRAGWYMRTNIAPSFRGQTPVPMAGQHVWRPMQNTCPGLTIGRVCGSLYVLDPVRPINCTVPGCTNLPSFAGWGIDGARLTVRRVGGSAETYTAPKGGGGNIAFTLRKNALYDFTLTAPGYVVPTLLRWKSVPITDKDVWMLSELVK